MKKNQFKQVRVVPRAMVPHDNGEAAQCGEAVTAVNVRESEQSLQVTGAPTVTGAVTAGDRLLLITGEHRVTCRGNVVCIDNVAVATAAGVPIGAYALGSVIVVAAPGGFTYLALRNGAWVVLDPAAAVPQLTLSEHVTTSNVTLDAYTFAAPYAQWQAPLANSDITALTGMLRGAWNTLVADAAADGCHTAPLLARWAVRLQDDSYLWMSEPVRLGDATLANANRITALVESGNSGFTGIEASTMTMRRYTLDIAVDSGIAAEWLPLVKSIDVFVTDEAQLLAQTRSLDYRCLTRTTGPREHVLEMGLARRGADAIARQLNSSSWHLVASALASAGLSGSDFVPATDALTLSREQCAAVGTMTRTSGLQCATAASGRLYCCTTGGDIIVSALGNAFVAAHHGSVLGENPLAMAVVTKPLYAGGFGRYPVYVFTGDGVFAIPQSATGTLGEARLVERTVIDAAVQPVEGGGDVWFVSRHHQLCRLSGVRLTVCCRNLLCIALAWCNAHAELWMLPSQGYPVVRMASGAMSERTVDAVQLYSDPRHAVAVSGDGSILDLEQEQPRTMPVAWVSHPVALNPLLGSSLGRVVWHMSGTSTDLSLNVTGQRGIMAQDTSVSLITVTGDIDQPLATAPMAVRARTVRLGVEGAALTGTLLLPTLLYSR
ncbi:MAG: hypothetical protein IKX56_08255 [Muribaculaceae bacterium]|nr:hypothetical protein [Muribaculaceae bacterium]